MNGAPGNGSKTGGRGALAPYGGPPPSGLDGFMMGTGPMTILSFGSPGTYDINFRCPDCGRGVSYQKEVSANPNAALLPSPFRNVEEYAAWMFTQGAREIVQAANTTPSTPK